MASRYQVRDQTGYWARATALLKRREQRKWTSFSWITVRALLSAINDRFSRGAPTLVSELRAQWMAQVEETTGPISLDDLIIDRRDCAHFIIIGDTGEQDPSQYVVVPALEQALHDNADIGLILICSDVIYPSGDVNDYVDGYYVPYKSLERIPTYALPGNHDWYDGLAGFMWQWCGQHQLSSSVYGPSRAHWRELPLRLFWRRPSSLSRSARLPERRREWQQAQTATLQRLGATTDQPSARPLQRSPYFAIQTKHVLLVCVDTGIDGNIDTAQGDWLLRISKGRPGPKILVTGKPLLVNQRWDECQIKPDSVTNADGTYNSVGAIVEDDRYGYQASIGGDVHNFQQYRRNERPHIVSGGGGAYMSATHTISEAARARPPALREAPPLALSPTEAESLSHFAELMLPRLWRLIRGVLLVLLGGVVAAVLPWSDRQQLVDWVTGGAIVFLGLAFLHMVVVPAGWTQTAPYRAALCLVSAFGGVLAGTATRWLSWGDGATVIWESLTVVGGLVVSGQALRWSGWWRPAPAERRAAPRADDASSRVDRVRARLAPVRPIAGHDEPWRLWAVFGALLLGVAAQLAWHRDWWLIGCTAVTAGAWAFGALIGRRRQSWRWQGVVLGYAVLVLDVVFVYARLQTGAAIFWLLLDFVVHLLLLAVAVAVVFTLVISGALLVPLRYQPTPLEIAKANRPFPKGTIATRLGRLGFLAPWLLGLVVAAGLILWPAAPKWGLTRYPQPVHDLPRIIVIALIAVVSIPILVDVVRRRTGTRYRLWIGAILIALAIVAVWRQCWSASDFPVVVGVLLVAGGGLVAVVSAHLALVSGSALLFDLPAHVDGASGRRGTPLVPVPAAQQILTWRAGRHTALPSRTVINRADVVSPGTTEPQGPLQKLVAEIFDSNSPPFFKNFLICDANETAVAVTAVIVTATEDAREPVVVSIPLETISFT